MKHKDINSIIPKLSKEQAYPVLIWSELENVSTIYLAVSQDNIKIVNSFSDHNLSTLFLKLQEIAKIDSFLETQALGDPETYPFEIIPLTDKLN